VGSGHEKRWKARPDPGPSLRRLACEDGGQDVLEYAILSAFVGVVALLTLNLLGVTLADVYSGWGISVDALWEPPAPAPKGGGA
jgi:hypothetical protein